MMVADLFCLLEKSIGRERGVVRSGYSSWDFFSVECFFLLLLLLGIGWRREEKRICGDVRV